MRESLLEDGQLSIKIGLKRAILECCITPGRSPSIRQGGRHELCVSLTQ